MGTININGKMQEATCPQERIAMLDTFEALGGKWKLPILRYLSNRLDEQNTFKKMQRELGAISAKVLTEELKELEILIQEGDLYFANISALNKMIAKRKGLQINDTAQLSL